MAFICKQYRLDKIHRKITASNYHMHQVLREHLVANKMQNRHGIILKASITLCLMVVTLKTKTDICKFNNSNKIEMEVHSLPNRTNSSSWVRPPIWAIYKTCLVWAIKMSIWIQWIFSSKRPSFTSRPLSAQQVLLRQGPEHQQTVLTITFMELPDQQITCNHQLMETWLEL